MRAVFLDRDGTINVDKGFVHDKEHWEYLDGALNGLKKISEFGYLLIIITNQSGIARGYYSEEEYLLFEKWYLDDLRKNGINIQKVYYCPHLPDAVVSKYAVSCNCRKPKTGLFWQAQREFGLELNRCFAIGDNERDLAITLESDVRGIMISDSTKGPFWGERNYEVCSNLNDAAEIIRCFAE